MTKIDTQDITGIVLAGGRGSRMGGVDKGLQNFRGLPLALHTLMRLQMQTGATMVNANRNPAAYEAFGAPVWPDVLRGYAGPPAGFLTGLERCETPWLLTVPCDTPLFPLDLAQRLAAAAEAQDADIAMAAAPCAPSRCSACCAWTCSKAWSLSPRPVAARLMHGRHSTAAPSCRLTSPATTPRPFSTPTRWLSCTRWKARAHRRPDTHRCDERAYACGRPCSVDPPVGRIGRCGLQSPSRRGVAHRAGCVHVRLRILGGPRCQRVRGAFWRAGVGSVLPRCLRCRRPAGRLPGL